MHIEGLNLRHLGRLRSHVSKEKEPLRRLLLTECVARAIKNEVSFYDKFFAF